MPPVRVAVLGAGGPTGSLTVEALLKSNIAVSAVVRDPKKHEGKWTSSDKLTILKGDVSDAESLKPVLKGCSHVVFAASTSSYFGAEAVDYLGVQNTAEAADAGSHVILVTSAIVTPQHRFHPVRVLLNSVKWYLMDYKLQGEEVLKRSDRVKHTIVRPGGLVNGSAGKGKIIVSQGDKKRWPGKIPRAEVAAVIVAAVKDPQAAQKTVEVCTDFALNSSPEDLKHLFDQTTAD